MNETNTKSGTILTHMLVSDTTDWFLWECRPMQRQRPFECQSYTPWWLNTPVLGMQILAVLLSWNDSTDSTGLFELQLWPSAVSLGSPHSFWQIVIPDCPQLNVTLSGVEAVKGHIQNTVAFSNQMLNLTIRAVFSVGQFIEQLCWPDYWAALLAWRQDLFSYFGFLLLFHLLPLLPLCSCILCSNIGDS